MGDWQDYLAKTVRSLIEPVRSRGAGTVVLTVVSPRPGIKETEFWTLCCVCAGAVFSDQQVPDCVKSESVHQACFWGSQQVPEATTNAVPSSPTRLLFTRDRVVLSPGATRHPGVA